MPTQDATEELWRRLKESGNQAARSELLAEYSHLIDFNARQWINSASIQINEYDIVQAATRGLRRAVDSYDPARNVEFATFATIAIRSAILDSLRHDDLAPRLRRPKTWWPAK